MRFVLVTTRKCFSYSTDKHHNLLIIKLTLVHRILIQNDTQSNNRSRSL
jgi:hypothetical protein